MNNKRYFCLPSMMKSLVILSILAAQAIGQSVPNQKPPAKGFEFREANLYKGSQNGGSPKISGKNARGQDYQVDTGKDSSKVQANAHAVGSSKNMNANAVKGRAQAQGPQGKTGVITRVGSGGNYETPKNKGNMKTSQQGDNKVVDLDSNGKMKLHVTDVGKQKAMSAQGNKHLWETNPSATDFKQGQLKMDQKPYDYTINKDVGGGKSQATLEDKSKNNIFFGHSKYTCSGQKDGVSTCNDEMGRSVGKVVGNKQGDVTVYNNLGIPIASGKGVKGPDGVPRAQVNNGLFSAESNKQTDGNCPGFTNDKVKIKKPLQFKYKNQQNQDGSVKYDWPDCFDVSGVITLPPGVQGKDIGLKWTVYILPAGKLYCVDPGTQASGSAPGDCLYYDMCDPAKRAKAQLLDNVASNICEAKGGQDVTATMTICPPPSANQLSYCDQFDKSITSDYWKKKGNLQVIFEVFRIKTVDECKTYISDPKKKASLSADYRKQNIQSAFVLIIPDDKLIEFCRTNQAEKIGCRESVVNYSASNKGSTAILMEAATASGVLAPKAQCKSG